MQRDKPRYMALSDQFFEVAIDQLGISQHPDLMELKDQIEAL